MGFEKRGNNYCLLDSDLRYDVYLFDRPDLWKWNQEMVDEEKFNVATLIGYVLFEDSRAAPVPVDEINKTVRERFGQDKIEQLKYAKSELYDMVLAIISVKSNNNIKEFVMPFTVNDKELGIKNGELYESVQFVRMIHSNLKF